MYSSNCDFILHEQYYNPDIVLYVLIVSDHLYCVFNFSHLDDKQLMKDEDKSVNNINRKFGVIFKIIQM